MVAKFGGRILFLYTYRGHFYAWQRERIYMTIGAIYLNKNILFFLKLVLLPGNENTISIQ